MNFIKIFPNLIVNACVRFKLEGSIGKVCSLNSGHGRFLSKVEHVCDNSDIFSLAVIDDVHKPLVLDNRKALLRFHEIVDQAFLVDVQSCFNFFDKLDEFAIWI